MGECVFLDLKIPLPGEWKFDWYAQSMAKPDRPNFSLPARIIFGVIALVVIVALLAFFGYVR